MPLHEKTGYAFDANEELSLITPRTRLIILNTPSNPTGGVVPRSEMDKLANGLADHPHVTILSDEIYARMLYDGRKHVSLLEYKHLRDRVIILDGWSKTYAMTGWRMGYGVWPSSLIDQATRLSINVHSCVNASAQFAGIAALNGPQDAVNKMVKAFDTRRRVIVDELNSVPGFICPEPGGAFYAFPNITGTNIGSMDLQNKLLNEAGVAIISGTSFGALGEGYLRFSYANSTENIIEAIRRVKNCL
jgi:aspartate aminotransferase